MNNESTQTLEELFTAAELARLQVYRDAVAAGFYTDDISNEADAE